MRDTKTDYRLLVRLQDTSDVASWQEFVSIYRPIVFRLAKRFSLQDADAENLVQQVLLKVAAKAESWDQQSGPETPNPETSPSNEAPCDQAGHREFRHQEFRAPGSFRRWLIAVARNAAIDAIRRIRPDAPVGGSTAIRVLTELPHADDSESLLRSELERHAFRWAAQRIRGEFAADTWAAFWETMVENRPCSVVAAELGKSVGAVYTARSRVMQRLKSEVDSFDWQNADDGSTSERSGKPGGFTV